MGFTKLDSGLIKSSLLAEPPETFKVFMVLLAICDSDGVSRASSVFLESVCRLPLAKVEEAIEKLSSKDPTSRSLAEDGARIRRVDGGYFIVNYQKYREWTYSNSEEATRKREYRSRRDNVPPMSHDVPKDGTRRDNVPNVRDILGHSASASPSASPSSPEKEGRKEEIASAFEKAGLGSILDEKLLSYLLLLWGEYDFKIDFMVEVKKKLAHLIGRKGKITGSVNFPLQFRNWMVNAVRFKERDEGLERKEVAVGGDRKVYDLTFEKGRIHDEVMESYAGFVEEARMNSLETRDIGRDSKGRTLAEICASMEKEAKEKFEKWRKENAG